MSENSPLQIEEAHFRDASISIAPQSLLTAAMPRKTPLEANSTSSKSSLLLHVGSEKKEANQFAAINNYMPMDQFYDWYTADGLEGATRATILNDETEYRSAFDPCEYDTDFHADEDADTACRRYPISNCPATLSAVSHASFVPLTLPESTLQVKVHAALPQAGIFVDEAMANAGVLSVTTVGPELVYQYAEHDETMLFSVRVYEHVLHVDAFGATPTYLFRFRLVQGSEKVLQTLCDSIQQHVPFRR
jgi:hypothetical protein